MGSAGAGATDSAPGTPVLAGSGHRFFSAAGAVLRGSGDNSGRPRGSVTRAN